MAGPAAEAVLAALPREPPVERLAAACGETECHLVGGVLRDRVLGLPTQDYDAVVAGRGRQIAERLAVALPGRLVQLGPGGQDFAAFRLLVGGAGEPIVDLWDRSPASLHEDLARRDFTVNSIALPVRGGALVDPCGGLADLAARLLRATTDAAFACDVRRVLRLARLIAQLPGFTAEPGTVALARQAVPDLLALARRAAATPGLREVAADRVRVELELLFRGRQADRGVALLAEVGLDPALWTDPPALALARLALL